MAVPTWFDKTAYFNNKLAQLGEGWDNLQLKAAFEAAGYAYTEEGLYQHFMDFGKTEGVSPTAWFDSSQYLYNKAAQFYDKTNVSANEVKSIDLAMEGAGMTPWDHFDRYWAEYYNTKGVFLNPSAGFDVTAYMNDKLALVQKDDPSYTMEMLIKAFQDAGLNPIEHYYVAGQAEGLAPRDSAIGATIAVGDEAVWGTNSNDYFTAGAGVLNDDTYIDGLGGNDTLYANIKVGGDTIAPHISNVETVLFRAQKASGSSVGNLTDAEIDAEFITGMKVLGSDNSRDSLKVEDVRIDSTDLTVRFSNSDPGNVDFEVYFNPQNLVRQGAVTTGVLTIQLIDTVGALGAAQGGHDDPLYDNPFTGFTFTLNGTQYTLNFGAYNHNTEAAPTYTGLLAQMQAAIDADATLSGLGLKLSLGSEFTATVGIGGAAGTKVTGTQILMTSNQGTLEGGTWVAANGLPGTNSTSATFEQTASTTCPLIQTNVQLDNVGRVQWDDTSACLPDDSIFGSQAGDMVIGSMAGRGGIERFDVVVDKGSWLASLSSTNNTLRMIKAVNGAVDGANDNGNLFIGAPVGSTSGATPTTDLELKHWMDAPRLLATSGLTDVKLFDASEMNGKVNIGAALTTASYDKYLKDVDGVDTMESGYAPNSSFRYNLGANDDTLNMKVAGGVAADRDFVLNINAGAGNDLVNFTFDFDATFTNHRQDQQALKNVNIDLGEGNDTFRFWGDGAVNVSDGAGNDTLYLGQVANKAPDYVTPTPLTATDINAVWAFNLDNGATAAQAGIWMGANGAQSLDNNVLSTTTSFSYTGATVGEFLQVEVDFKGIKVTGKLRDAMTDAAGNFSAETINRLIIDTINNDAVLSKLLVAKDGSGASLLVESLINGQMNLADLKINFSAVKADGSGGTAGFTITDLTGAYDTGATTKVNFASDGTTAGLFKGDSTGTDSVSVVNMGQGNDVIVMNAKTGADTLVMNGEFNHDVVLGFETGVDKIDFTAGNYANKGGFALATAAALDATVPQYGLTGLTVVAGKNLVVIENTAVTNLGNKSYWVFEVDSADATFDANDTVKLLGSINTDATLVAGDFTL